MSLREDALKLHSENRGKISIKSKVPVKSKEDLTLAYSPGVAEPCLEIHNNYENIFKYTAKSNMVAVVSNGTAVLGLGNIGADASLPVMEGKAILFKSFAGVDAFPICVDTMDPDKIIEVVQLIQSSFGGVNLEDIKAPECFYIEKTLKETCKIPVFHDDQHGTAIVCLAAAINALKIVGKKLSEIKIAVNGAGAAAISVSKLLLLAGATDISLCDIDGVIYDGRPNLNDSLVEIAKLTNKAGVKGTIKDIIKDADMFIGLSVGGCITEEMIASMNRDAIVFAMANPTPEIMPELAEKAGAAVIGTGRSDYPNQINNVLAFPGIFRGALDVQASQITDEMKVAAAEGIAALVSDSELNSQYILPGAFDERVAPIVAEHVAAVAIKTGIAQRTDITPAEVAEHTRQLVAEN